MKKSKRLTLLLTALLLVMSLFAATFSASAYEDIIYDENLGNGSRRVFDFANLLNDSEIAQLESKISSVYSDIKLDIVVVTVNSTYGKSDEEYADDFFDYNGFGYGSNYDGVLLLINMDSRTTQISTCGSGIDYLSDSKISDITDDVTSELKYGNYYDAIEAYVDAVDDSVGSTFKLFGLVYRPATIFICLGIALLIGLIYYARVIHTYKYNGKTEPYPYRQKSTLHLTNQSDVLVDTHVVTRRIERSGGSGGGGGSSTHTSSSGRSHGGGGGHF